MTIDRLWLSQQQDNLKQAVTSFIKSKISLLAAVAVAFSVLTGMTASQLKNYTVYVDGQQKTVVSDQTDEIAILKDANVTVSDVDVVKTEKIDNKVSIHVIRKCRLELTADGKTTQYVVARDTVGNVLKEMGITISDNDAVNLSLDAMLPSDAQITVDRVEYKTVKKDEIVTYSQYVNLVKIDSKLDKDILSQGQRAVVTTVYENKMVNGEVAETVVVDRVVQPIATKPVVNNASGKPTCGDYSTVTTVSTLKPTIDIVLDENGVPTIVQRTSIICPQSLMGPVAEETRQNLMSRDGMNKYDQAVDNESAYEVLTERQEKDAEEAAMEAERAQLAKERAEFEAQKQKDAEAEAKLRAKEEAAALKQKEKEEAAAKKKKEQEEAKKEKAAERRKNKIENALINTGVQILKRGILNTLFK